ncbi:STAS domain-containing protein [Streptomyces sp. NPDC006285]|uniref:STAS domain-containing protein n=1 Tax=Streptomyces sp. NPDC006285 TaxID=3364742 RepID=UPI0036992297
MADSSVEVVPSLHCLVARVSGEMTQSTVPLFRARFRQLIVPPARVIVLDLAGVSFCDSAGLNVLLAARRQAHALGAVLRLAGVPQQLQQTFRRTGTDQVLRLYDSVIDAETAPCS